MIFTYNKDKNILIKMGYMNMNKKIRRAIILVADLGTRFLPETKAQPKEMLSQLFNT